MNASMNYVDGNAAGGELSRIFAVDITNAEGQCANCGAKRRFAEAHLYVRCPGLVARCPVCGHVLLRLAKIQERLFLDLCGMTRLTFDTTKQSNATS
jgi:DNA-directed RNA polymerase subunit RPC12/RpoP